MLKIQFYDFWKKIAPGNTRQVWSGWVVVDLEKRPGISAAFEFCAVVVGGGA